MFLAFLTSNSKFLTYPISSNFCKKRFSGMLSVLDFSIFLVSSFSEDFLFISFQQKN